MCIDLAFQAWENSLENRPFTLQKSILFQYTAHWRAYKKKASLDNGSAQNSQKADSFKCDALEAE